MSLTPTSHQHRDPTGLIGVAQAAALLGVHANTIRTWADQGRLASFRINSRGDRRFRRSDVEQLLSATAAAPEPVGSAARRRSTELALLSRLAEGAATVSDEEAICRLAVSALHDAFGYGGVAIALEDEERGLRIAASAGASSLRWPPDELVDEPGICRLPLRVGRRGLGYLVVGDESLLAGDDHHALLTTAASTVALAIHHRRLVARVRRELRQASAMRGVTRELTGQLDLGAVLTDIVERCQPLFEADKVGLWLYDETREHPFTVAARLGIGQPFLDAVGELTVDGDTIGIRAIRQRRLRVQRHADRQQGVGLPTQVYAAEGIRTVCIVPLLSRNRALGVLGVYHADDHGWSQAELTLVQSFADQAAVAIANARLYRSVADQAARMRSIQDLSSRLNRLTDVRAIASAIVSEAEGLADYHDIRVYSVDWERRMCDPIAFKGHIVGASENMEDRLRVAIGQGLTGWVAEHAEPLLVNDALSDPRGMTIEDTEDVPESMLVVPMIYEERVLGVIVLSKLGFNQFSDDDLQTMTIFAGYAAQAVANAAAYQQLEAQSTELKRQLDSQRQLLEVNARLQSTLDQGAVLEAIADGLKAVVDYDNLSIYRADRAEGVLVPVLARETYLDAVMSHHVPFGRGLMGWTVEHAEPVLVNDALSDPRTVQIPGTPPDPEAVIIVPLVAAGEVIGAMNVGRIGGEEVYFSSTDFELVKLFAGQASVALRNAATHEAERLRADTDELTGLRNHGAFQRRLASVLDSATAIAGDGASTALLMMDLDNFKAYNDRFGHPAGDALLHAIATAIGAATRTEDPVYRYGGDEFALILTGADRAQALAVAERIREAVAALTAKGPGLQVTISAGVALYPEDAADKDELIAVADTALYLGKHDGGNRVVDAASMAGEVQHLRTALEPLARAAFGHAVATTQAEEGFASSETAARRAMLHVARRLATADRSQRSRGERVGRLAARVAQRLGADRDLRHAVELAGRLAPLPATVGSATQRAGRRTPSLRLVEEIASQVRRRAAGGTASSERVGLAAEILAVSDGYDALLTGRGTGQRVGRSAALSALANQPPGYRREVLEALSTIVGPRSQPGRRRRRSDAAREATGAA